MELVDHWADADWLRVTYVVSEPRLSWLMGMAAASYLCRSQRTDEPLRTRKLGAGQWCPGSHFFAFMPLATIGPVTLSAPKDRG